MKKVCLFDAKPLSKNIPFVAEISLLFVEPRTFEKLDFFSLIIKPPSEDMCSDFLSKEDINSGVDLEFLSEILEKEYKIKENIIGLWGSKPLNLTKASFKRQKVCFPFGSEIIDFKSLNFLNKKLYVPPSLHKLEKSYLVMRYICGQKKDRSRKNKPPKTLYKRSLE